MPPEAQTVLHTWCRQTDWNGPTIVGGAGGRLLTADALDLLDRLLGSLAHAIRTGTQP